MKPLVLSNFDPAADEIIYANDVGSWNVTRALRDCRAGRHNGYTIDVAEACTANANVEVDAAKITAIAEAMQRGKTFEPGIGIVENNKIWFIDGHHRLRAHARLGRTDFRCWIIEQIDAAPYQIFYNGRRKAPFKPY